MFPLFLSACATDQASSIHSAVDRAPSFWCAPKMAAGKGRIWIYRTAPKRMGLPPDIVVDNRLYEALRPDTAYTIDVAPGKHEVKLAYDKDKLDIEVVEGSDTFIRFDLDPAPFGRGFFPILVVREIAKIEIHEHTGTDFTCTKD
ncbi:hypothetical protein [Acidovorax soli]|uniref:hypothetical protein n=1 Tax=Acidovorax soli TaxID=592050 RepID=UPI0032B27C02